jgi:hypothetical protein
MVWQGENWKKCLFLENGQLFGGIDKQTLDLLEDGTMLGCAGIPILRV